MLEQGSFVKKEVTRKLTQKTVVINGRGDLSVDGVVISGTEGRRVLNTFMEGVEQDILERGAAGALQLYRKKGLTPGSLSKALQASVNITRMLDAEDVSKNNSLSLICRD